jgi:polysaccharide pyruvyl transferase WcaK-like protein
MHVYVHVYMCVCDALQTVVMSSLTILYFLSLSLLIIVLSLKALLCSVSFICVEQQHSRGLGRLIIKVLTFICLRDTSLSYDFAHRTVRS